MTIAFTAVTVRHERRITLTFSTALAAGAFTSTAFYTLQSTNGFGTSPNVLGVIPNVGNTAACDLALDADLAGGGRYTVAAIGVPAVDTTVTPVGSILSFEYGVAPNDSNVEITTIDVDAIVFGTDLVWSGTDFLEAPNGDLATTSGIANYQAAMSRRLSMPSALAWAPGYGVQGGDYVNGPRGFAPALRGALIRQANADDRTAPGTTVTVATVPGDPTAMQYVVSMKPKGATDAAPVSVGIPIP